MNIASLKPEASNNSNKVDALPPAAKTSLKDQAFAAPERVREVVKEADNELRAQVCQRVLLWQLSYMYGIFTA